MNNKEDFTRIYKENSWGGKESRSGLGSDKVAVQYVMRGIASVIAATAAKSILDCACGDFNWMADVMKEFSHIDYTGVDIVEEMIAENQKKYPKHKFLVKDIATETLPKSDLVICRDCLVHLPLEDGMKFISNFIASESKFLLITSFGDRKNTELEDSPVRWRPISLQKSPFNLPPPMMSFNEKSPQPYCDKSFYLYRREQLV